MSRTTAVLITVLVMAMLAFALAFGALVAVLGQHGDTFPSQIHVVVDRTPVPCNDMFGCGNRADPGVYGLP